MMEMSRYFNQIKAYVCQKNLPLIPINAHRVSIINEPDAYYRTVLDMIKHANQRLMLSALYLGTGTKENEIVDCICDNVTVNKTLDANIVLDAHRATRLDENGRSSCTVLEKALDFANVKLTLIESRPNKSFYSHLLQKFEKWNEISSTYHAKLVVSDNDTLITGANLSSTYFETRQDRYMLFQDSKILTNYLFELVKNLAIAGADFKNTLESHNAKYTSQSDTNDCYIIPLIQHGPSGIRDKEEFLQFLDSLLPQTAQMYMSSGYFNPSPAISSIRLKSSLVPSEKTNGFYGGAGLLRHIPKIYSALHHDYIKKHPNHELLHYDKPQWSFHAKGLWVEGLTDICLHLIGSSNFGCRSANRDFELELVVLTTNKNLEKILKDERALLWAEPNNNAQLAYTNIIHKIFAKLLKRFL